MNSLKTLSAITIFSLFIYSCDNSKTKTSEEGDNTEAIEAASLKNCRLDSMATVSDENRSSIILKYNEQEHLVGMNAEFWGQVTETTIEVDATGKMIKTKIDAFGAVYDYEYDDQGRFLGFKLKGQPKPFAFTLDQIGNVASHPGGMVMEFDFHFTYEGSQLKSAKIMDKEGKLVKTITYKFDDKVNPLVNLPTLNQKMISFMYGYPAFNSQNNLVELTETYEIDDPSQSFNGQKITKGMTHTMKFEFEYNEDNYPKKIKIVDDPGW